MKKKATDKSFLRCERIPMILPKHTPLDIRKFQLACRMADRRVRSQQKFVPSADLYKLHLEGISENSLLMTVSKTIENSSLFHFEIDGHDVRIDFHKKDYYRLYSKQNAYAERTKSLTVFQEDPNNAIRYCLEPILKKASFHQLNLVDVSGSEFENLSKVVANGNCHIPKIGIKASTKFNQTNVEYPSLIKLICNTGCTSFTSHNLILPENFWKYPQIMEMKHIEIRNSNSPRIWSNFFLQMNKCTYFYFDGETDFSLCTIRSLLESWYHAEREIEEITFGIRIDPNGVLDFLQKNSFTGNVREEETESTFYFGRHGDGFNLLEITTSFENGGLTVFIRSDCTEFLIPPQFLLPLPLTYVPFQ